MSSRLTDLRSHPQEVADHLRRMVGQASVVRGRRRSGTAQTSSARLGDLVGLRRDDSPPRPQGLLRRGLALSAQLLALPLVLGEFLLESPIESARDLRPCPGGIAGDVPPVADLAYNLVPPSCHALTICEG